jgi:hypothetical protein
LKKRRREGKERQGICREKELECDGAIGIE